MIACVLISASAVAQVNRYMVFFKDKAGTSFSVSNPTQYLSVKAIARRIKQEITITEQDIPVNASYIQGIRNEGVEVFYKTKWLNGVLIQCDQSLITTLQNLSFVKSIELVAPGAKLSASGRKKLNVRKRSGSSGVETENQLKMVGINTMHADGFRGEGITIAILDSGFPGVNLSQPFQDVINEGRINTNVSYDFVYNTTNIFQYDEHGAEVFSVIGAYLPDVFTGGARFYRK